MNNYNFTPTLDGLNNIEADNITATSGTINNLNTSSITGDTLTNCNLVNCTTDADPLIPDGIANKNYVDNAITSGTFGFASTIFPNTFSSSNTFSNISIFNAVAYFNSVPECTGNPTTNNQLMRKSYGDNTYSKLNDANNFYGQNTFNTYCPISSVEPTDPTNLTTKNFVDTATHSIAGYAKLVATQTFSGINTFSNSLLLSYDRIKLGLSTVASADETIAIGKNASSSTISSIAIGADSIANGSTGNSTAIGCLAKATGIQSTALGRKAEANHFNSTALGYLCITTADYQTRIGTIGLLGNITDTNIATDTITNRLGWNIGTYRDGGVIMLNGGVGSYQYWTFWKSTPDMTNFTNQINASGTTVLDSEPIYGAVVGTYLDTNIQNQDDVYIVFPNWGVVVYASSNYTGAIRLNYYNDTSDAITVKPSVINGCSSIRILYNHVLL